MELHTSFDRLSEVVERYERHGQSVRCTDAASDDVGGLRATLEVPVSLCPATGSDLQPALSPERATLTDAGGLNVEFSTDILPELPADVSVADRSVRVVENSDILLTVTVVIDGDATAEAAEPTDAEQAEEETKPADDSAVDAELRAVRDESVPPYEDRAYLQRLYETCDTFAEMSQKIEMDVAGETVRRYMIDVGVHTPSSYETRDAGSATTETGARDHGVESPARDGATEDQRESVAAETTASDAVVDFPDEQFVTDGLGLPDGVRITDIAEAVTESSTVYDVQRRLDLEGEQTWELLQQLDLLELLVGRISEGRERSISYELVTSRIRQSTANTG